MKNLIQKYASYLKLALLFVLLALSAYAGHYVSKVAYDKKVVNLQTAELEKVSTELKNTKKQLEDQAANYAKLNENFDQLKVDYEKSQTALNDYRQYTADLVRLRDKDRATFERKLASVTSPDKLRTAVSQYELNFERCLGNVNRFATEAATYSGHLDRSLGESRALRAYIPATRKEGSTQRQRKQENTQ